MTNELLQFEDGTLGIALNLDVHEIGVVILGDFSKIEEGQEVKRTGEVLSVPVGDAFLGRVVNPLGSRSTASARSSEAAARSSSRRPTSCSASRCTSRCRPASRPSTR
jgi:F0F1-type ATP synthase alpha subunit